MKINRVYSLQKCVTLGIVWENLGKHSYNLGNNNLFIINEN